MGIDYDQLFPSRFLKAGQFQNRDVTLTIKSVDLEKLPGKKGDETKGIVAFIETEKQLVLNRTNGECLKAMWGRDTAEWAGKRVTLYPAEIDFEGHDLAIRVRGSPDLAQDLTFTLSLARKKPRPLTLKKTEVRRKGAQAQASAPAPAAPPPASAPVAEQPKPKPVKSSTKKSVTVNEQNAAGEHVGTTTLPLASSGPDSITSGELRNAPPPPVDQGASLDDLPF